MKNLPQQLNFLLEAEKLKEVYRRSSVIGTDRRENSAEHSWFVILMAMTLAEHSNAPVDILRVMKMLAIHDIVEIDAGDTFHYHKKADTVKEAVAAERLFGLLPAEQAEEFKTLWVEFEERGSNDARFAAAIDRIWPVFQNVHRRGGTWIEFGVTFSVVHERLKQIADGSTILWKQVDEMLRNAEASGYFSSV